jgi:tetratricopeptide (TPR) repeat protein
VAHLAALDPAPRERSRAGGAVAATPARMLRELADALDVFTRARPLLLVLDDLQWSDRSSVDLLACLARRPQPARLLVVGSVRPADMRANDHPLLAAQHELQAKGLCEEIALSLLSRDDVGRYLEARFGGAPAAALRRLAARVHERTEGNALFMLNMVNDLVSAGLLAWRDDRWQVEGSVESATDRIPAGLRELLDRRLHRLAPAARKVLEAASVAGDEFAVAAVAAAVQMDAGQVEDLCEELAAPGALIVDAGLAEWPDGSVSGRYRFQHALYRGALYEGIAEARRVALHRAIGRREEAGFAERADEHAAELAMHYSRGRSHQRALHFHELAAAAALDRHAPHEAVAQYTAALAALNRTPESAARMRRELPLAVARATLLMAIEGYAAPATEAAYAHARRLCDALPAVPQRYPVLRGLLSYLQVRAEFAQARALSTELLQHAERRPSDALLHVQAHYGVGTTVFHCGSLPEARRHLEAALRRYDPASHRRHILAYGGYDPGVACSLWLAWTLILQGEVEDGLERMRAGIALAERHGDAFTLAWVHQAAGATHQLVGDWAASGTESLAAMRLAEEHGFPHVLGMATANRGWALMMQGEAADGIAMLRDGVAMVEQTGARLIRPSFLGMLAAAHMMEGDWPAATASVEESFAEMARTGESLFEAALLVEKSRMLVADRSAADRDAAEACLRRALAVSRAQGARLLELRVAVALVRHARGVAARAEARELLEAAHAWFVDRPAATRELVAARQLLAGKHA